MGSTAEIAARYAGDADRDRVLHPDVAQALVGAGFARHFVPTEYCGTAGTFTVLARALIEVGTACASAAWCGMIFATSSRMAGFLPAEGRHEIWADSPDVPIAAALVPNGSVPVRGHGGWRLSGQWRYLSGVDFAHWALLCATPDFPGDRENWFFAVPSDDFSIQDTWHTVGMRGTGSNTLLLDDVFVPDHRCFPQRTLLRGVDDAVAAPCYRIPLLGAHPPLFAAPTLGAARMGVAAWTEMTGRARTSAGPAATRTSSQLALTRSTSDLDAAQLLLERATATADSGALDDLLVARNVRDATAAAEHVVAAVERVFRSGGMRAQTEQGPVQRAWRDVHTATSHAVLDIECSSQLFARSVWRWGD
ncbi:hydrolase [Longimycelium tulufanense]|uniref:hydrolase n=1 Tax=Longimycelium tulufanense TaxID=907463 RepID=UPI001E47887E|nr:hydrolase [Longimycelium tulufanense]